MRGQLGDPQLRERALQRVHLVARDAVLALQLVNVGAYDRRADTDCNAVLDAFDAGLILKRAVGIVPELCLGTSGGSAVVTVESVTLGGAARRVTVSVRLETASPVVSGQLVLEYEPRVLANPRVSPGALASGFLREVRREGATLHLAFAGTAPTSGSGVFIEVTFDVVTPPRNWRTTEVRISGTVLHAPRGGRLTVTERSGTISVK